MLMFTGLTGERAARLRGLADGGCAVTLERPLHERGMECIIELRGRRVVGRGRTADEAAADALGRWERAAV